MIKFLKGCVIFLKIIFAQFFNCEQKELFFTTFQKDFNEIEIINCNRMA